MTTTLSDRMSRTLRADVQGMHGYAVQPSAGFVKVDTMENPFRLPPALRQALGERLAEVALNRYPAERGDVLRAELARHAKMPAGCDIMLGNGSDELISLLAMAVDLPVAQNPSGQPPVILAPEPGFVMYGMSAQFQGLRYVGVPLTADFELDEAAMLAAIRTHRPAIVYIAYPNNPTANLWDDTAIANIIALQGGQGGLVVMDEAYQPFSSRTWLTRMREAPQRHGHVLLMRTLSKFGLAGVRIGYLVGQAALVAEVNKLRPPYNISSLNAECALFALEHAEVFRVQALDIAAQRAIILRAFAAMPGVRAWRSDANMVLVRVPDSARAFEGMKASGVLVKNVAKLHPLLANCLRVTVGTAEENVQMLAALAKSL
jgi:histidinol-phosphate aminotransferase